MEASGVRALVDPARRGRPASLHRLIDRELSWIAFDRRVLELAADRSLPLLERVKFCAIASSNLDEFFAVRMAELHEQGADRTLAAARAAIVALQAAQDELWTDELRPALAEARIRICTPDQCRPRELRSLSKRFEREVLPLLTPIAPGPSAPFSRVPTLALNVGALVADLGGTRLLRITVPQEVPRFLEVGNRGVRVPVEDAIVHFLPEVVGRGSVQQHVVFRATRDADLSISSDADDLLEALEIELRRRRFGDFVRLEVDARAPSEIRTLLTGELAIEPARVYETTAPLGLGVLTEIAALDRPDLRRRSWRPVTTSQFSGGGTSFLSRIRRRDLLAHHPYDAYDSSVERFLASSHDPKVVALKTTVYRTAAPSVTLSSLVDAAEDGKQAVCLVELRARFDERHNIEWSRALDRAGVQVVHGIPGLKIHAKLCLLVRRERAGLRRYVHIGSGNYHATTASAYEDLSLFTADEDIAADVADVFNAVTGNITPPVFRKLLVGPWFLRDGVLHEIERVTRAAAAGEPARIRIKVNALVDPEVAEALYAAADAGATVEAITRGMCVIRPLNDRITVRSVLGPFLEHSRILSFQAGERTSLWIGSADLMPRNLDRRVEVLAPVEDARIRARIEAVLDALLADTRFAWQLGRDGSWTRHTSADPVSAQELLMEQAVKRAKRRR